LRRFPRPEQASRARLDVIVWLFRQPSVCLVLARALALLALITPLAQPPLDRRTRGALGFLVPILLGPVQVLGFAFGFQWAWRKPMRRHLRRRLVALGVPVCLECGYDLRGQTEARCPECGAAFDPHLLELAQRAAP
jgi:hypothetical protein